MTTDKLTGLPEQIKRITVNAAGQQAGLLTHSSYFSFLYSQDAIAVSLTMPNNPAPYNRGALHPVFTQNLPEGYLRRYISEKLRRYAEVDDMYLLALMGTKGIGHLSYDAGIQLPSAEPVAIEEILHWSGKEKLFPQLLERYYLNGMASGVQPKVVVSRSAILQKDVIVKTFDEEFPLLTVNEFVCMKCAEHCGLNTPKVWLSDDLQHYVVERFDTDESGYKIGIEDFATLMGRTGDQKYLGSYENMLKVVNLNTGSMAQVEEAFKLVAFNCLIGNGDAHLKNFSLQYQPDHTEIGLSPVYDITHTLIYPTIDNEMALKMRKSKAFPSRHELVEFAYTAGISRSSAGKIVDNLAEGILVSLSNMEEVNAMDGLRHSIEAHLNTVMERSGIQPVFRHDKKKKYK